MAYAEFWRPIREATSNINRTINIMADRDAQRQAQGLRNLMALDSLTESKFRRDMAKASGARDARRLELAEETADFTREQGLFERKIRESAEARAVRQQELEEENMSLNQKIAKAQEARAAALFEQGAPARQAAAAQAQRQLKALSTLPQLGPAIENSDPRRQYLDEVRSLEENIQYREDQIKAVPKGVHERVLTRKADLERANKRDKERLEELKGQADWKLIDRYEERQQKLESLAVQYSLAGVDSAADMLRHAAAENSDRLQGLYKQKMEAISGPKGNLEQKYAYLTDENGNVIETRIIGVPDLAKGVTPADIDPKLEGYEWGETLNFKKKTEGRTGQWTAGSNVINDTYGTNTGLGWVIEEENKSKHRMAHNAYSQYIKAAQEAGEPFHELTAANNAIDAVNALVPDYWKKFNQLGKEGIPNYDPSNPEHVKAVEEVMEETSYAKDLKAIFGILPPIEENPAGRINLED